MLEQKEVNTNVVEESDDIKNKSLGKNEEMVGVNGNKMGATVINSNGNNAKKPNLLDTFKANIIDLAIIGGISAVLVFAADAILKLTGYAISQKFSMSFIIFMVVMVLYMSIMESGKGSNTVGKKISGLTITKE
ncbi:RDD family protein [Clostridium bowmanii]|uniref:RDD family protein n=1 Tax=Clostridium bowmanii TaxID=132925 RepID=UPI001C0AD909|nr:RDD family protein [Clostridium bowmanii]MBU3192021.1 RDD family protein [Clostridium bowmanii]MCA1076305.1 RDD family protein [Clostridium bowmanii]